MKKISINLILIIMLALMLIGCEMQTSTNVEVAATKQSVVVNTEEVLQHNYAQYFTITENGISKVVHNNVGPLLQNTGGLKWRYSLSFGSFFLSISLQKISVSS